MTYAWKSSLAALGIAALLIGCGDDGSGPSGPVVGEYELTSYYGHPLPYSMNEEVRLDSGDVTLREDSTSFIAFHLTHTPSEGGPDEASIGIGGTWRVRGDSLVITNTAGCVYDTEVACTLHPTDESEEFVLLRGGSGELRTIPSMGTVTQFGTTFTVPLGAQAVWRRK